MNDHSVVAHEEPQASRYVGGNIYDNMEIHVMTISMHEDFIHRAKSTSINLEILSTVENFKICDIAKLNSNFNLNYN